MSGSLPALANDTADNLKQAAQLVHEAWNPAGDPLSDDKRTELLAKALDLAVNSPQRHVHGHRVKAIAFIRAALDDIKNGDPDKKVNGLLHDADSELRESISETN